MPSETPGPRTDARTDEPLVRLIYRSVAVGEAMNVVLRISPSCVTRNRAMGLTSALLYSQGHFVQALEGTMKALTDCFAFIERDPGHTAVTVVRIGPVQFRLFPDQPFRATACPPAAWPRLDALLTHASAAFAAEVTELEHALLTLNAGRALVG